MNYLTRLKAEISRIRPPAELTEPTKGAFVSFVSSENAKFSEVALGDEDIERAAIIEHEAGVPAFVADRHAREGWQAEDWRLWLSQVYRRRLRAGDGESDAEMFTYNAAINEWHARHSARQALSRCPGCDGPIAGHAGVLALPAGERVHGTSCLVLYGARWRAKAAAGLAGHGVFAPTGWAP